MVVSAVVQATVIHHDPVVLDFQVDLELRVFHLFPEIQEVRADLTDMSSNFHPVAQPVQVLVTVHRNPQVLVVLHRSFAGLTDLVQQVRTQLVTEPSLSTCHVIESTQK